MKKQVDDPAAYRPGAGILLLNARREAFVAQRIDNPGPAWQMPQGGLEKKEEPRSGALRELTEETSIRPERVAILDEIEEWISYDLPTSLTATLWKGKYRGQRQKWFCGVFLGSDDEVDLATQHPEFNAWKWVPVAETVDLIVPFKRDLYREIIGRFEIHWRDRPL
ncbi:MAG: RNA pyrophosphohydrolase [Rhodospirillales bacterium]